MRTAGRVGR
jgi:Domain of unknown function (DUF4396)